MEETKHRFSMDNRTLMDVNGVLKVESSDEGMILLKTAMGDMVVAGEGCTSVTSIWSGARSPSAAVLTDCNTPARRWNKAKAKGNGLMKRLLK